MGPQSLEKPNEEEGRKATSEAQGTRGERDIGRDRIHIRPKCPLSKSLQI